MDTNDQALFGRKVRGVREAANTSRELAAERAGITASYLGEIERGEKWPSLENIRAVARALNVSASVFFQFEDEVTDPGALLEKLHRLIENRPVEQQQKALKILKTLFEP
jgi:transcriptional regulator with XRE-family HTH domain